MRYKKLFGPWFDYLMVSRPEMEEILVGTGWKIQQIFQEENNPNYVAVLEKL